MQRSNSEIFAPDVLTQAIAEMEQRGIDSYDKSKGDTSETCERSMAKTVKMFNVLYGKDLTVEQGWMFMCLLKMVRSSQGAFKLDNYVDLAAYASLAAEDGISK